MKIINLISGPRNLSTALMYAFAQRKDITVVDEPFYAYYLTHGNVIISHPSTAEILKTLPTSFNDVLSLLDTKQATSKKHLFIKGMAHHYIKDDPQFILGWDNVILIRHPRKLLTSFAKVIENPTIDDIGIKKASEIFRYLQLHNKTPIVIDSDALLENPKNYLMKLCSLLDIKFSEEMLHWDKGGIKEDGVWASHWYKNVHNSTGFLVQKSSNDAMPKRLKPVLDQAMNYYNILSTHILKND